MNETLRQRVLIIDDEPINIQVIRGALGGEYELFFATNGVDALKVAEEALPDLILLDIMMPEMDGYEVCRRLKENQTTARIPVIFITAKTSVEEETKGLEIGAIDYIAKPISPPIVKVRIRNHLELKRHADMLFALTEELAEKNQLLERVAREDTQTGLANRRHFNEIIEHEVRRAIRNNLPLSLVICDIDFFKLYNDHYGHVAGDDCLQSVGRLIHNTAQRGGDLPARYGGEEFAVILPGTDINGAQEVAHRIVTTIWNANIPHAHSSVAERVTMSAGAATMQPVKGADARDLISKADEQLYLAKKNGRNRVMPQMIPLSHSTVSKSCE